mgnify:CR=1 FL=1
MKKLSTRKIPQKGDPFKITPGFTIYSFNLCFIERVPICSAILQLQNPCILCFVIKRICKSSKDLLFALAFPRRARSESGCKGKNFFLNSKFYLEKFFSFFRSYFQKVNLKFFHQRSDEFLFSRKGYKGSEFRKYPPNIFPFFFVFFCFFL